MFPITRRRSQPLLRLTASFILLLASDLSPAQTPGTHPSTERMRKDVFFLAGPECEGRGIETAGINKAADYVAAEFKAAGLKPGGKDDTFFQPFTITTAAKLSTPTKCILTGPDSNTQELSLGKNFSPLGFSPSGKASGGLVFVGYGITAPDLNYDDYAGVDVAGKVVIMLRKTPRPGELKERRFDTSTPAGEDSPYAPLTAKIENAQAHKAAAVIIVNDSASAGGKDTLFEYREHSRNTEVAPFPVVHVKRVTIAEILQSVEAESLKTLEAAIDKDLKPHSFPLKGWSAEVVVTADRTDHAVKNVIGYLEGSGSLRNETVVIGGHYDHLGKGQFGSMAKNAAGKIHYGADDNASGTSGVMELARRNAAMKNRQGRRLVFICFSGEERGCLGSLFYCKNPRFPLEETVAMLNMDMIGRSKLVPADWLELTPKKDQLIVYGTGSGDNLAKILTDAGEKSDFRITSLAAGTGPSDHDSFYRKKVPVLFLYTGTHDQYHQPTDTPDRINFEGMKKVVDLVQAITTHLSTSPSKPRYLVTRDPWIDPTDPKPAGPAGPRLGIRPDYNYEGDGVLLEGVTPGGAAEKAGLKGGDVIVEVAGKPIKVIGNYMTAMAGQKAGQPVEIVYVRKGEKTTIKVTPQ